MRTDDCFEKRLLRRTKPDPLKVTKALEMAEFKNERVQQELNKSTRKIIRNRFRVSSVDFS